MELFSDPEFYVGLGLAIFIGILLYVKVPALVASSLDARAAAISKELADAQRLREEASALLAQYVAKQGEAEKEAAAIVTEARAEAERYAKEAQIALATQIERRAKKAQEKIAHAEAQAVSEVRALAADAAVAAAEKLIAARLDDKHAGNLVKQALAEIPAKLN